jgi:uncharacterized protein (DUF779 family)
MFFQSGGCCDGTYPICLKNGELRVGADNIRLGEIGGASFYRDANFLRFARPGRIGSALARHTVLHRVG